MGALPSGTVTFLFTDIEGSTQLWEKHPEAIESDHRHIIKITGDGVHAVFMTALDGFTRESPILNDG